MTTARIPGPTLALTFSCLLAAAVAAFQAQPAAIRIVHPPDGGYVSGPVTIRVSVTPPSLAITRMLFYADNTLICTVDRPPFECAWNAGPRVDEHSLRVVAQPADGSARLTANARTKGEEYVERVEVERTLVTATVTDQRGRYVKDLTRQDFRILEDDVPQRIESFVGKDVPLEITVAVDMSGSMIDAMPQVKRSVTRFLQALRPKDQVTLNAFNDNLVTLARPSADLATRLKSVNRLAAWGGTALYDEIVTSIQALSSEASRRALVVFSDGDDTASRLSRQAAEARVQASDAVVYTIGQGRGTRDPRFKAVLDGLAKVSGGRAFFTDDANELDQVFAEIIEDLANQYLIGYEPTNNAWDGKWHRITVKMTDSRLRVRARQGRLAKAPEKK